MDKEYALSYRFSSFVCVLLYDPSVFFVGCYHRFVCWMCKLGTFLSCPATRKFV